jgi:glycosyltransferase involved in cell wall biosynthesis
MEHPDEPAVLHFNDCASVGQALVTEAARQGHHWAYAPPEQVRPAATSANRWLARAQFLPYLLRRRRLLARADVVHVHYATSARLLRERGMPRRPYVLHLHGSDIRSQWPDPAYHDEIQRAIDEACHVYYANLDTTEQARTARSDAEYLPILIDLALLPPWRGSGEGATARRVLFVSRWDEVKGADANLELARELSRAVPAVELVGLDWGPRAADAADAGVRLLPRVSRAEFLGLLASADVAVGQARPVVATSELEAMAIGVPTAALGSRIPRPDDATTPPVIEGGLEEVVSGIRAALGDPAGTAEALGGREWVRARHAATPWVPRLLEVYRAALDDSGRARPPR